jgi:hypothetical protein
MRDPKPTASPDVPVAEVETPGAIATDGAVAANGEFGGFDQITDDIVHANMRRIPINEGEGDWYRTLTEASHDRIEVRGNVGWGIVLSVAGALAIIAAIVLAVIYVPDLFAGKVRKPGQVGIGIVSLFTFGCIGLVPLFYLGMRQVFDQKTRTFTQYRWNTVQHEYEMQPGFHLVLVILPADNDGDHFFRLELHNADCSHIFHVAEVLSTQPSAGFLARLAGRVAVLLNVPLRLRGTMEKGHPDLKLWWGLYQRIEERGQLELPEDFDQEGIADYAQTIGLPTWIKVMVAAVAVTMLVSFLIVSWQKALIWIFAQGIGMMLFFMGHNAVKTGEAEGTNGMRFSGTSAKWVGAGQMLAGVLGIVVMPIVLLFSPEPKQWGMHMHVPHEARVMADASRGALR